MALVSCSECGREVSELAHACPNCGNPNLTLRSSGTPGSNKTPRSKSKSTAVVLALFLGIFGAHKFYMGSSKLGVLYLLFSWTTIPFFLGVIDAFVLVSKDPSHFAGSVGSPRQPNPTSSDEYSWRSTSSGHVPTDKEQRNRTIIGFAVVGLIALFLFFEFLGNPSTRDANPPVNISNARVATNDQACSAMKSAGMAVATLGKKVMNGNATPRDAGSVKSALKRVNAAYPQLDGAIYSYLVSQGNSMDLLIRSVESGDFYSAGVAVQSYLDGDRYSTYCQ